jgi:FADH2-dependent halogenase
MKMRREVVIVGGGPAGAAAAMHLARKGIKALIIERETFPRFHIGESMTGEAGGLLRALGVGDRMARDRHPVKHGVKVYGKKSEWFVPVMRRTQAGELEDQGTWQVRRSIFDKMLLDEAIARGAEFLPGRATKPILDESAAVCGVHVRPSDGGALDVESTLLLDCTGQATFLATNRVAGPKYLGAYDKQVAFFSHTVGFERDRGSSRADQPDNTVIFYKEKYHWAWAIPIDDEVTSVGVVIPCQYFLDKKESKETFLIRELKELNHELSRRLPEVKLVEDVHVIPNYSFQVRSFAGPGYLCVGDSHRFVDPIFSFGLYMSLKEAELAAGYACEALAGSLPPEAFHRHMVSCESGIDVFEDTIDTFWENPIAFAYSAHKRYREDLIDVFAGRVYGSEQPSAGVRAFRRLLRRERTYGRDDHYSMPIGSRYDPERAGIWHDEENVRGTETWMKMGE